jgi:hypothetical protein
MYQGLQNEEQTHFFTREEKPEVVAMRSLVQQEATMKARILANQNLIYLVDLDIIEQLIGDLFLITTQKKTVRMEIVVGVSNIVVERNSENNANGALPAVLPLDCALWIHGCSQHPWCSTNVDYNNVLVMRIVNELTNSFGTLE